MESIKSICSDIRRIANDIHGIHQCLAIQTEIMEQMNPQLQEAEDTEEPDDMPAFKVDME